MRNPLSRFFRHAAHHRRHRSASAGGWSIGSLEPRVMLAGDAGLAVESALVGSSIQIEARGETGEEGVFVYIDGELVSSFVASTQWQTYDVQTDHVSLSGDQLRIAFVNDVYDPENDYDRNLTIGDVAINGQVYDTNGPDVFSTGSYLPEDQVTPGTGRGNVLHTNGYFQYAAPQGSRITVYASGQEGVENFVLRAGTEQFEIVQVTQELQAYEFQASEQVDPSSVRIRFTNDRYFPSIDVDRNLTVDRIVIDGVTYETEADTVLSTGVVVDGSVQSGFTQSDTLHTDGYFQYNASVVSSGQHFILDTDASDDGKVELGFFVGSLMVARGSEGQVATISRSYDPDVTLEDQSISLKLLDPQGNVDLEFNGGVDLNLLPAIINRLALDSQQVLDFTVGGLQIDSQGRMIVAVNTTTTGGGYGTFDEVVVLRVMASGDLDASFANGRLFRSSAVSDIQVDSLDRVLLGNGQQITRLDNLGRLDSGFGNGGTQLIPPRPSETVSDVLHQFEVRADNSIILLWGRATSPADPAGYFIQLNEDGSTGTWFGDQGFLGIPRQFFNQSSQLTERFEDFAIDPAGRLTALGRHAVLRFTVSGQIDTSFGDEGRLILPGSMLSDGESIIVGQSSSPVIDSQGRLLLLTVDAFVRVTEDGQLDRSFSSDGFQAVSQGLTLPVTRIENLLPEPDGGLIAILRDDSGSSLSYWELV